MAGNYLPIAAGIVLVALLGLIFVNNQSLSEDKTPGVSPNASENGSVQSLIINQTALEEAVRKVAKNGGSNASKKYWSHENIPSPVSKEDFIQAIVEAYPEYLNESSQEFLRCYLRNYGSSKNDIIYKAFHSREDLENIIDQHGDLQIISSSLANNMCMDLDHEKVYKMAYQDLCRYLAKELAGSLGRINCSVEEISPLTDTCLPINYPGHNSTEEVCGDAASMEIRLESLDEPQLTWVLKTSFILQYPDSPCGLGIDESCGDMCQ